MDLDKYDDCKEETALLKKKDDAAGKTIFALKTELEGVRQRVGALGARLTADSLLTASLDANYRQNMEALQGQINAANRKGKWGTLHKILIGIGAGAVGILIGRTL